MKKEGEVEEVSIDGDASFTKGDSFPSDAKVVVRYHAFSKQNPEESQKPESPEKPPAKENETQSPEKTDNNKAATDTPAESATQENLTIENNPELKVLLSLKDPGDPSIPAFAEKYKGRNIEFDASICYMAPHGNFKYYFDFLICPGDYNPDSQVGPQFKIENKNVTRGLRITGNAPEYVNKGDNIRLVAEVLEFNPNSQLFFLKPVQTTYR